MGWVIVASVAAPLVIGGVGAAINGGKADDMENDVYNANQQVENLLNNRQGILNQQGDYNALATDMRALKGELSNAYANLGVATNAAEMQQQQADVALANMLEGSVQMGYGAGGATALANAALKSKQGVAADIQKQEAANQKLKAQGEAQLQKDRIAIEQAAMSMEVKGLEARQDAWEAQEAREVYDINRAQGELDALEGQQVAYENAATDSFMAGLSGATSVLSSSAGAGFKVG